MKRLSHLAIFFAAVLLMAADKKNAISKVHPDEKDAVTALNKLGASLEIDKLGRVTKVEFGDRKIHDADLVHLMPLTKLTSLQLEGTEILSKRHLKGLVSLETLDLENARVYDLELISLIVLPNLQTLNLTKCSFLNRNGTFPLKKLSGLKTIGLSRTNFDDTDLELLTQNKGLASLDLRTLNLSQTNITNAGLKNLRGLHSLTLLNLNQTNTTKKSVQRLQKVLPKTRILHSEALKPIRRGIFDPHSLVVKKIDQHQPPETTAKNGHPLDQTIRGLELVHRNIPKNIKGYSCTLVIQKQGRGLENAQRIFMKVRHKPFSVYMYFISPDSVKGRKVVYIEGKNENKLLVKPRGLLDAPPKVIKLPIHEWSTMGPSYSITELGILNLTERLIEVLKEDRNAKENGGRIRESIVNLYSGSKLDGRKCDVTQIVHPVRGQGRFHIARIFVSVLLNVPIRYESHDWPKYNGEPLFPSLIERHYYQNLVLDNNLDDDDFRIRE